MASYTTGFAGTENPLSEAGAWTSGNGDFADMQKVSGVLRAVTTGLCGAILISPSITASQYAQLTLSVATGNRDGGPCVGLQSGTNADGYIVDNDSWANELKLLRHDDPGGFVQLGSSYVHTPTAGDVVRVQRSGTNFTVYLAGISRVTATDATYSGGQPGVWIDSGNTNWDWDDFDGGDLVAAQDTPELWGRPFGNRGADQMQQLLAQ